MYNADNRSKLLQIARGSIAFGLESGRPCLPNLESLPDGFRKTGASFVTLSNRGVLRGCTGSIVARRPLGWDVAENAFSTAFKDARFTPLEAAEFPQLLIEISLLSTPREITFINEADLLDKLQPYVDGLVISAMGHKATFLPKVWENLREPRQFLNELKVKAGLGVDYSTAGLTVSRYRTEIFAEPVCGQG
ncbi:MAG: AmmeMemoRadiSam system protein A [Gammaproteobacteria bacterium]|nr:AmmeMemoRadiSam system protein A [Gammaproteobacteria bacterium]